MKNNKKNKKNKKNKILKQEKAVIFDDTISLNTNNNKSVGIIWETIYRGITLLFCIFSILYTLNITIGMSLNSTIVIYTVLFVVLFTLINNMKKYKIIATINIVLIMFFLAYWYRIYLFYGIQIVRTNFIDVINKYYFTNYETYFVSVPVMTDYYIAKTVIMVAISFILSLYFSILLKRKKSMISMLILFSILFYMAVNFSIKPNITAILLIMFTFLSVYSLESKPNIMLRRKNNNDFYLKTHKNKRTYLYSLDNLKSSTINRNWLTSILLIILIIILVIIIFPKSSYKKNELVDKVSKDPLSFIENFWDKFSTELPYELNFSQSRESGVGNGDLKSIDRTGFAYQTHLKVKMGIPTHTLLKGYVGSVYESERFSDLDKSIYDENKEMFSQFEKYNIFPHTIGTAYLSEDLKNSMSDNLINIENVNANRNYAYVPYGLKEVVNNQNNNKMFIKDTIVNGKSFSNQKYSFKSYLPLIRSYDVVNEESIDEDYIKLIKQYTDFVYDNYLDVPDGELNRLKQDFKPISSTQNKIDMNGIRQAITQVKDYLYNHAVYDLSPGKKPTDKDYIEYFLYENHKGYCSHFATSATIMFRLMGIPARYVEGYTITQNDLKYNMNPDNSINVMDSNAHAWTELYLSTYGWVPLDVTPGFNYLQIATPASNVTVPDEMITSSKISSEVPSSSSSNIQSSSSTISQNDSSENINNNEVVEETKSNISVLFVFLMFFGVIIIIFLILVLRNFVVVSKRRESFSQRNLNNAVIRAYAYIENILSFIDYKKNNSETDIEFVNRVSKSCKYIHSDSFLKATNLVLKARFSKHNISESELKEVIDLSNTLNEKVFKNLKFKDKFKYRLIDNLK